MKHHSPEPRNAVTTGSALSFKHLGKQGSMGGAPTGSARLKAGECGPQGASLSKLGLSYFQDFVGKTHLRQSHLEQGQVSHRHSVNNC